MELFLTTYGCHRSEPFSYELYANSTSYHNKQIKPPQRWLAPHHLYTDNTAWEISRPKSQIKIPPLQAAQNSLENTTHENKSSHLLRTPRTHIAHVLPVNIPRVSHDQILIQVAAGVTSASPMKRDVAKGLSFLARSKSLDDRVAKGPSRLVAITQWCFLWSNAEAAKVDAASDDAQFLVLDS